VRRLPILFSLPGVRCLCALFRPCFSSCLDEKQGRKRVNALPTEGGQSRRQSDVQPLNLYPGPRGTAPVHRFQHLLTGQPVSEVRRERLASVNAWSISFTRLINVCS
jgi:hypothetical protein